MGDYLEVKVTDHTFFRDERTDISFICDLGKGVFNLPFLLKLNRGDKLHFSQVNVEKTDEDIVITHNNYRDVEITKENETNSFLKLDARDMRLLEGVKRDYKK